MSDCKGCAAPDRGIVITDCRQCCLRDVALGPHFMASMRAGWITREYANQLKALGRDVEAIHQEVKAVAKATHTGAVA